MNNNSNTTLGKRYIIAKFRHANELIRIMYDIMHAMHHGQPPEEPGDLSVLLLECRKSLDNAIISKHHDELGLLKKDINEIDAHIKRSIDIYKPDKNGYVFDSNIRVGDFFKVIQVRFIEDIIYLINIVYQELIRLNNDRYPIDNLTEEHIAQIYQEEDSILIECIKALLGFCSSLKLFPFFEHMKPILSEDALKRIEYFYGLREIINKYE